MVKMDPRDVWEYERAGDFVYSVKCGRVVLYLGEENFKEDFEEVKL
jgi:hypothetical protein